MKKTILTFLLPICVCSGAWAQKVGNPNEFAQTITAEDLEKHLKVIAADSMEGRDTGSEGMRKAGRYIAAHFKELGLLAPITKGDSKSYMQEYMLAKRAWQATTTLSVGKNTYKFGTDFYALRFPSASPFELKAEVVIVPNDGIESLEKMNVKGKAVVFLEEKVEINKRIASRAKELGAVAVIVVKSLDQEKFKEALQTNAYYYSGRQPSLVGKKDEAIYYISPAVAKELLGTEKLEKALKQAGKPAKTTVVIKGEYSERIEFKADNILGFLEGTDKKNEILVITAHYDHVGMQGGKLHTVVNLNIDMVGRIGGDYIAKNEPNYIYLIGSDKLSTELHNLGEEVNKRGDNLILDYKYNSDSDPNRFYYRSDHYNFAKNNIPIIFYFNGVHEDYHKPTDDVEKINFAKMTKIARLVFNTAWEIANRDNRLVVDKK
ncbi:MAG: M28 family peptidase [Bacteroidetes bacterium]|nr:MAG: M28 family peptidase [Bacteroidota bacterium]